MRPFSENVRVLRFRALSLLLLAFLGACSPRDAVEEHRKLSLRLEHRPPGRVRAGEMVDLHARIDSSLEGPKIEAWVRILGEEDTEERIPLQIGADGQARAAVPGRPRGRELRYVVEARDAAGLVVTLPRGAEDGEAYVLRFEGKTSRILGGISLLSALLSTLLFLGAGAAGAQCLRGRMSAGPAGLLGGAGGMVCLCGLLLLGAIHAVQVSGRPWPSSPLFWALSRGDLALVTLLWAVNLFTGRRVLLDEEVGTTPGGERPFAAAAVAGGVLTVLFLLF